MSFLEFLKSIATEEKLLSIRPTLRSDSAIHFVCLISTCVIAFIIRLLPLQWGAYLSEFDPYGHYRVAEHIATQGFIDKIDYQRWHPQGAGMLKWTPLGLPATAVFIHKLLTGLGFRVSLMEVCMFFPPVMGIATCLAIYLLANDIAGKEAGLLSALFLAMSPGHIERTYLGFFKHETIGVFLIIMTSFFFLRSIRKGQSMIKCIAYSILAGLSLSYLEASWGAGPYTFALITLFTLALLLLRRHSPYLLCSFITIMVLSRIIGVQLPRPGWEVTLFSPVSIVAYITIFALIACEIYGRVKGAKGIVALALFIAGTFFVLQISGLTVPLGGKIANVLNPVLRGGMPIVESVAEHRPATWNAFFLRFGALLFLAMFGLIFAFRKLTNENIYLILFSLSSLYFASSMVRLILIMAPAFVMLSSLGTVEILKPFIQVAREIAPPLRKRMPSVYRASSSFGIITGALLATLIFSSISVGVSFASTPVTIASSTIPVRMYLGDWLEACAWMRDNTPPGSVICCWWDYGYYVTVIGNRTSLADNATLDTGQIEKIALAYMSNETRAVEILKAYDVSYVLVFTTLKHKGVFAGDEAKWYWMATIARLNYTELIDQDLSREFDFQLPNRDCLLTKLMLYGTHGRFKPTNFELVFESSNSLVFIYKMS